MSGLLLTWIGSALTLMVGGAVAGTIRPLALPIWTTIALMLVGLNILAIWFARQRRLRGYAIGIWIAQGVPLLLLGACFAFFRLH